jgi:hypothetical protein
VPIDAYVLARDSRGQVFDPPLHAEAFIDRTSPVMEWWTTIDSKGMKLAETWAIRHA